MHIKDRKSSEQRGPAKSKATEPTESTTAPPPAVTEDAENKTAHRAGWKDNRGQGYYRKSEDAGLTPEEYQAKREAAKAERRKKQDEEMAKLDIWHNYRIRQWKKELDIKLDTELPSLPGKDEKLEEPSLDELKKQKKDLKEKQMAIKKKLQDFNEDIRRKKQGLAPVEGQKAEEKLSIYDIKKEKHVEKNKLIEERKVISEKMKGVNAKTSALREQFNKLKEKMTVFKRKEALLEDMAFLDERMNNETLSLTEEKKLMKEKASLELSLPFADIYYEIKSRLDEESKEKNVYMPRLIQINKELDRLREEITDLATEIDIQKEKRTADREKGKQDPPEIQAVRDKYIADMDEIRKKIESLDTKYDDDLKKYDLQQCFIERVLWAIKQKKKLEQIEKAKERRAKYEEERKKQEEEERALHHPYQKQLDLCNELTSYLSAIKKTSQAGNTHTLTETKEFEANYTKFLENASLKKEKLVVQVPKRAQEIDHPAALSKKKRKELAEKKKKQEAKASEKVEEEKAEVLYHHPEVLRNFDLIKIAPPNGQEDIDKILATLDEKRKHFDSLKDQEPPAGEGETERAEKEETPEESTQEKRGGKGRREERRVDFQINATDFPSFE